MGPGDAFPSAAANEISGWEIPIHVDAASGGFVAPFIHPDLEWDFRLPNVVSINVSGHQYGLVHPGIGRAGVLGVMVQESTDMAWGRAFRWV